MLTATRVCHHVNLTTFLWASIFFSRCCVAWYDLNTFAHLALELHWFYVLPRNRICVSHISKNMGYCLSKKRICHMGHHGIKILCGFSFYSTEYFCGVGGWTFWLMRLLAFNLWYIDSVCTKWIEHIQWLLLCSPHELCRAARTITQLSIHGVQLQQREPKTRSIFFVDSLLQFSNILIQSFLFIALPSQNELHQLPTWQKYLTFYLN